MMLVAALAACAATSACLGVRQAHRQAGERKAILAPCLAALADPRSSFAADGYPRLSGRLAGRRCRLAIVPDSLALRRLPQLWLTLAMAPGVPLPELVVTARPCGDDYVSKAFDYPRQVDVPSWLPRDVMVRLGANEALAAIDPLRAPLAALFADPLVKELALGRNGVRLVYRLAEGERASHLLLRQCRFAARVDAALFDRLVAHIAALEAATIAPAMADAA